MKKGIVLLQILLISVKGYTAGSDTIRVYFDFGIAALNEKARMHLDSLAYYDVLVPGKEYGIIGYADFIGKEQDNSLLSQQRAENIAAYLLGLGVTQVSTITGKGEVSRTENTDGYPEDRRVDIIIGGFKQQPTPATTDAEQIPVNWQVFFEHDNTTENSSIKLKPKQNDVIAGICQYLKKNESDKIKIMGYYGGNNENVLTAFDRAEYIKWRLEQCGIAPARIRAAGHGLVTGVPRGKDTSYLWRTDISIGGNSNVSSIKESVSAPPAKLDITKVEKNETVRLENIFFLPGSHFIRKDSEDELFALYINMKDNPGLKIQIEGHICCLPKGNTDGYDYDSKEYGLSVNRAKYIYEYLLEKGIPANRMAYKGYGISQPLKWPERSVADENMNRRVEIRIVDK